MATVLRLYREALYEIGIKRHADRPTDIQAAKDVLDDITYNAVLAYCLEQGQWNFAMRDDRIFSTATPSYGFSFSFAKPADWVRTAAFSAVPTYQPPLEEYADQGILWQANVNPIHVKYVSNNASWGLDLTRWPESYARFVELELAWRIAPRGELNGIQLLSLEEKLKRAKASALAKDAQNEAAPRRVQPGRLVQSRFTHSSTRIDPLIP